MINIKNVIVRSILWILMLAGLVVNIMLLQEIYALKGSSGAGSAQQDFGLYFATNIAILPVLIISAIVVISIYLSRKENESFISIIKYGYGVGFLAIVNCIASLIIFMMSS